MYSECVVDAAVRIPALASSFVASISPRRREILLHLVVSWNETRRTPQVQTGSIMTPRMDLCYMVPVTKFWLFFIFLSSGAEEFEQPYKEGKKAHECWCCQIEIGPPSSVEMNQIWLGYLPMCVSLKRTDQVSPFAASDTSLNMQIATSRL